MLASRATEFISSTPVDQPLFLYFAPFGPHAPYTPAPRDLGTLDGKLAPYTAADPEPAPADLPRWMQNRRHFTQAEVDKTRQPQLEALMSIDDAVGSIVQSLQQGNRPDRDTLFVFMSDNGYFWGEHTIIGKDSPYDASTRIPMVMRWDGHTPPASTSGRIVLNVDIAGTIAAATGASMPTDGLDILGDKTPQGVRARGDGRLQLPARLLRLADPAPDVRAVGHRREGALRLPDRPRRGAQPGAPEGVACRARRDAGEGQRGLPPDAAALPLVRAGRPAAGRPDSGWRHLGSLITSSLLVRR